MALYGEYTLGQKSEFGVTIGCQEETTKLLEKKTK
jgi:hypothetical protein